MMIHSDPKKQLAIVAAIQGLYYVFTGFWAIRSISTFLAVTGPKTDLWLVKTVGVLVLVSGLVFLIAAFRERITFEVLLLAIGDALGLMTIEVVYVALGTISAIYLVDALGELALVILYFSAVRRL